MGRMKVAFLGPEGTFTEEALYHHFSREEVEAQPFSTIADVLEAVDCGLVDRGIVPIENSLEGSVNLTLDWLAHQGDLWIGAEVVLPILQNLLALPGTQISDVREIGSHPHAIAQCRNFLRTLPNVTVQTWESTARAAQEVAKRESRDFAAIGTAWAAKKYGLSILKANIGDSDDNHTRFIVVERRPEHPPAIANKTMLLVYLAEDRAGALVHILNVFVALGINLTKIESRPTRKGLGSYHFLIDLDGGLQDEAVQKAITIIGTYGHRIRVLGSFLRAEKI
jgi:prephenate dehydratase